MEFKKLKQIPLFFWIIYILSGIIVLLFCIVNSYRMPWWGYILMASVYAAFVVGNACWCFMSHEEKMKESWVYRTTCKLYDEWNQ